MKIFLWLLGAAYALLVGVWHPAAAPLNVAASGVFVALAQPAVLLLAVAVALIASARRRPAHAPARH